MRQAAKCLIISLLTCAGPLAAQDTVGRAADSSHARVAEVLPDEGAAASARALAASPRGLEVGKSIGVSARRLGASRRLASLRQGIRANTATRVGTGAAIGFGLGALLGGTVGHQACLDSPRWHCAVNGGAVLAGVGALVAWRLR